MSSLTRFFEQKSGLSRFSKQKRGTKQIFFYCELDFVFSSYTKFKIFKRDMLLWNPESEQGFKKRDCPALKCANGHKLWPFSYSELNARISSININWHWSFCYNCEWTQPNFPNITQNLITVNGFFRF